MGADDDGPGCCAPDRGAEAAGGARTRAPVAEPNPPVADRLSALAVIPATRFRMGGADHDANPDDGEGPVRPVALAAFRIARTAVTNAEFAGFVDETGYVTGAERWGWSFVFAGFVSASLLPGAGRLAAAPWWCRVERADWRHPEGPGSCIAERADHPVVHIDHGDALAYCAWAGGRLPTEAEWECAARGGLDQARFPWGDDLTPGGEHRCNIWQGRFPLANTGADGYLGTAPVAAFAPNGFGLHNMVGNVWEWCADRWGTSWTTQLARNPTGPAAGGERVLRGGSYLCHASYCNRYRVAARTRNDPSSAAGNIGFRLAADC